MNYKLKINRKLVLLIFLFIFLATSQSVFAEESFKIYFKGPEGPVAPGSEVVVGVFLESTVPINAFDLEISYPKDKLEFLDSDNTGSIVNIWQNKPNVSSIGKVGFSGGILKAFSGKEGFLVRISFRSLSPGAPKLSFTKSNLYIANGKGTEVKASSGALSFYIEEGGAIVSSLTTPFQNTPEDIFIGKELENFKSKILGERIFTPLYIFIVIIFVILALAVYNKRKRKL